MKRIPPRPDLGHLKKQAKELLALYRSSDPAAINRFRDTLPSAAGKSEPAIQALGLRLHDAQSCIAREYGFASWADLHSFVLARNAISNNPSRLVLVWLGFVYAGDIAGSMNRPRPLAALRLLEESPDLRGNDPYLACAIGDEALLREAIQRDPAWVNRPGGPLNLPPLVAVTHSGLMRLPDFRPRLRACAKLLLDAGADPHQSVGSRWPPASLNEPSATSRLSALYGAAGQNHDASMTALLLEAGADPNDGESLYHSLESIECTRLLLKAGARIDGTNALYRVLDLDDIEALRLLLSNGANPNESTEESAAQWGTPLLWAIRRRRSVAHVQALLDAGADAAAKTRDGVSAYVLALRFGLTEVADLLLLRQSGGAEPLAEAEAFVAACARGDRPAAERILQARPRVISTLSEPQLRMLSELASQGCSDAVRAMVDLGWPIDAPGGDWNASALNQAVFRGDAPLARFLLERGASMTAQHGFGDNVCGTLSWASVNEPAAGGDWLGCAEALVSHGLPAAQPDPDSASGVLMNGRCMSFSDEVTDFLLHPAASSTAG